jgi:hypothetical protein
LRKSSQSSWNPSCEICAVSSCLQREGCPNIPEMSHVRISGNSVPIPISHYATPTSHSELMWGKRLRSPLDLLVPSKFPCNEAAGRLPSIDTVYARTGPRWLPVKIKGNVMYKVRLNDDRVATFKVQSDAWYEPIVDDDLPQEPETSFGNGERESLSTPPLAAPDNAQR